MNRLLLRIGGFLGRVWCSILHGDAFLTVIWHRKHGHVAVCIRCRRAFP